jgi:hypothetical protein
VSRVRENRTHGSLGGRRKPAPVDARRTAPGASRLPDRHRTGFGLAFARYDELLKGALTLTRLGPAQYGTLKRQG